jgi:hypothetical protein
MRGSTKGMREADSPAPSPSCGQSRAPEPDTLCCRLRGLKARLGGANLDLHATLGVLTSGAACGEDCCDPQPETTSVDYLLIEIAGLAEAITGQAASLRNLVGE